LQGELREAARLYFEAFTELMVTGGTSKNDEGERPLVKKLADSEWKLLNLAKLEHEQRNTGWRPRTVVPTIATNGGVSTPTQTGIYVGSIARPKRLAGVP
jgi:hypothetical protein